MKHLAYKLFIAFSGLFKSFDNNMPINHTYITFNHHNETIKETIKCEFCKDVVSIIERRLHNANETIDDIEKLVERICSLMLSKPKREACDVIVHDIDEIKNMIMGGLDRKQICYKMELCPKDY